MSKTHLVLPDPHAHPDYNNDRAIWAGKLIKDLKPDVVINLGDTADVASLSTYDKGKGSFHGRNYEADINSHLDFQEKLWHPIKKSKKKLPRRVVLEGNHEHRIKKVIDMSPELAGDKFGVSFKNLELDTWYQDVVEYEGGTPGIIEIDGVAYAHFFISGVMGKAIGGVHHASSLLAKNHMSSTCGHSHLVDYSVTTTSTGKQMMGLVAGVYQDYDSPWAGNVNKLWWPGLVIKREVEDGVYCPEFVSMEKLRKEYG